MTNRQEFCATLLAASAAISVLISIRITALLLVILCAVLYSSASQLARQHKASNELLTFYRKLVISRIQKSIGGNQSETSNKKHTEKTI